MAWQVTVQHASGQMSVGAAVDWEEAAAGGRWVASRVAMSRSARRLMDGCVYVPKEVWPV